MTFIRFVNITSKGSKYIGFEIKKNKGLNILILYNYVL